MLAYAMNEMELGVMVEGATTRQHYESLWRQSGEMPGELEPVPCPEEARYLWDYFISMSKRRTGNGYQVNALSSAEVQAWAKPRGIRLEPFEIEALDALEIVYLAQQAKKKVDSK